LNIQKQLIIDDYTYIQLFGKNIWNELINKINHICSKCNKKTEKLYETKTNINFCKECLLDLINNFTENKIILNNFEKSNFKFYNTFLGQMMEKHKELTTIFDLDEAIDLIALKTQEKSALADQRLKNNYETLCCNCTENKKNSPSQPNDYSFVKFDKIDIYDRKTKQIDPNEKINVHLICGYCVDKHKADFENKKTKENTISASNNKTDNNKASSVCNTNISKNLNNKNNNFIDFEFFCGICNYKHMTIMKNDKNVRNSKKACCAGCSIF